MSKSSSTVAAQRAHMVQRLRDNGIEDRRVLDAMAVVPRERFVAADRAAEAYQDHALPIGAGQTISAPQIVAVMAAELELGIGDRVLDVGAGSGYAAAVLSRCAGQVIAIERHRELAERARSVLAALGYANVEVRHGDGALGAPDQAPFDAISVAAMASDLPPALVSQLATNGRLVCPLGHGRSGQLVRLHHGQREVLLPVAFVPMVTGSDPD